MDRYDVDAMVQRALSRLSLLAEATTALASTLDAQITYKFSDYLSLRVQGKNLTDSVPQKLVGVNQQLNYSALENGRAFYFGVAVAF